MSIEKGDVWMPVITDDIDDLMEEDLDAEAERLWEENKKRVTPPKISAREKKGK